MSQQDNFAAGFVTGAFLGGIVGGVLGAIVSSRLQREAEDELILSSVPDPATEPSTRLTEARMELARQGLEDKIAQLNEAIDDVRQQLGKVNGYSQPIEDASTID
ncbi:MAG: hypothetical protein HC886_20150 [Leptolyngbyaceae cyanobacterium SM1_1_3]|nr:hypothetical protein [Leptolyngbyaceae cyanobacterium SM1_1_3]